MRKINFSAEEVADIQQIIQEVQDKLNAGDTVKTGEIRPTNLLPILMQGESGREAVPMRWGFPSSFKKGLDINAKAETVLDPRKHYWNKAKDQHCIIMSTGFYEWQEHEDKSKTQM